MWPFYFQGAPRRIHTKGHQGTPKTRKDRRPDCHRAQAQKRLGLHAAALQIAKKAIEDYVVTPDIKIAVTLPSTIACIPWRRKSEKSEEA